jgi:hypothetical protein
MVLAVLVAACARPPKPLPKPPARIMDSPPEQRYALNEAAQLGINVENRRFGYDQEKEVERLKKEEAEQKVAPATRISVIPMPAPQTGGRPSPDGGAIDAGRDR